MKKLIKTAILSTSILFAGGVSANNLEPAHISSIAYACKFVYSSVDDNQTMQVMDQLSKDMQVLGGRTDSEQKTLHLESLQIFNKLSKEMALKACDELKDNI